MTYTSPSAAPAVRAFLDANPDAQRAALHDARFAAELEEFRPVLEELDAALDAEGLDGEARARVGARLLARAVATPEQRREALERLALLERTAGDVGQIPPEILAHLR